MILRPYQEVGRDFLAARKVALLADEMRVGKTPQAILAAQKLCAANVTVVCPAIAVAHWHAEFDKWWPDFPHQRIRIMSYNKATALWEAGNAPASNILIVDEAHFAKSIDAKRTHAIYGKNGFAWRAEHTWALSGTPAPKHAGELYPVLRAFGAVGLSHRGFIERYCDRDWMTGRPRGTKKSMIPELRGILSKIMLRRTRKDVAPEMPSIDLQFLEVVPTGPVPVADGRFDNDDAIVCDLTRPYQHPNQLMAEFARIEKMYEADPDSRQAAAMSKVQPLVEEIADTIGRGDLKQTVVFGWHVEPLKCIAASLRSGGITVGLITGATPMAERVHIQKSFRYGGIQVVVANIMAAGTAIDLSAASHGYFLEQDWVPGNNLQAANRLVSMEKSEPVTFDIVTAPGTIDDAVQRVLRRRTNELRGLYEDYN